MIGVGMDMETLNVDDDDDEEIPITEQIKFLASSTPPAQRLLRL